MQAEHQNKESLSDEFLIFLCSSVHPGISSAHVCNDLSNFQKADGAAVMMGQLAW